ncbi:hypothetical protein RJ640_014548 [Escallonia rubra]|uniref:Transducin/WD40 repeat-like superfamily protein n=1 Tax=Escallonia rubra TaxID=112253 RepID=A0AA88RDZ7_9ASTE|nr:hypothetical protein RJ640_014548 [Escallonia rubra]
MRGGTVQINWHDTKPVLTLDFHPTSGSLATGGADFDIKLWLLSSGDAEKNVPSASYQNSLSYHGSAVNALRFSPCGSVHQILDAHFHYVQGVAFDPLAKYAASLSSDRTCRIYVNKPQAKTKGIEKMNYVCQHVITKAEPQMTEDSKKVLSNGNKIPLQKPEEMATIEAATNKTDIVGDSKKAEVKKSDGEQASPSLVSTPVPNKPAKRRITPMAID